MKTIASIIAAVALTASVAHAASEPMSGWTEVVSSDAPGCLSIFGGWSSDEGFAALDVFHDCESEVVLTCPLEGGCRIDNGALADQLVLEPGEEVVLHVPVGSGDISWQMGDSAGTISYEGLPYEPYECGLSVLACKASPGITGGSMGWLAFALIGLGLVRRRARGERA